MCNHYQNHPEALQTWREYVAWDHDYSPFSEIQIDVWPRREGVVARIIDGTILLEPMTWGVPLTTAGKRPGSTVTKHITNVRNLSSPFWRNMLSAPAQRCLVPFTRFAEPKIGAGREEHWFTVTDRPVAAFAGIWRWFGDGEDKAKVYAFLTCEPNPLVAPLHPKAMPVILDEGDYDRWLTGSYDDAVALAVPFPSQLMGVD